MDISSEPVPGTALPTDPTQRIVTLDILRGVAVLGILIMNIEFWALPIMAMPTPVSYSTETTADLWIWKLQSVFIEGSMRALFSLLFGAGFMLFINRLQATGRWTALLHNRRMFWLIAFGIVHGYILLFPGDILFVYGLCGLALYPLRRFQPRTLLMLSLICFIWLAGIAALEQSHHARAAFDQPHASLAELNEKFAPAMLEELDWRGGSAVTIFRELAPLTLYMQTWDTMTHAFCDAFALMLLGAALFKWNILTGAQSARFYLGLLIVGYAVGLAVNVLELQHSISAEYLYMTYRGNWLTYDLGRVFTMLGHVGLIILFVKSGALQWFQHTLGAVGRMALTNYIMHTIICGLLFYGYGLGLVGKLSRAEIMIVVAAIWLAQLIISPLWLRCFRFGPLEWLWRTLTYGRIAPLRRK